MKKLYFLFTLSAFLIVSTCSAVVVTIDQTNNTFAPAITNVNVGDVIHFVWSSGTHTTTSVSIPSGAASWDAPLTSANTSFDYTVTVAGNYGYVCTFHSPNMAGGFQATIPTTVETVVNIVSDFTAGVDFNSHTIHVNMDNATPANAILRLIDITGREVAVLLDSQLGMGKQSFHFDMSGRNPGIYFIRLEQNGKAVTRRVMMN